MEFPLPAPDPDFEEKRRARFMAALEDGQHFDLFSRDPGEFADLAARVPGVYVTSAGGHVPFQAEGRLLYYPFYFRYEYGSATLRLGAELSSETPFFEKTYYIGSFAHGGEWQPTLDRDEFVEVFTGCVKNLKPAPFLWKFLAYKLEWAEKNNNTKDTVKALSEQHIVQHWGFTPEEALASAAEPSEWLAEKGISVELQEYIFKLEARPKLPLNKDERDFSDWPALQEYLKEVI